MAVKICGNDKAIYAAVKNNVAAALGRDPTWSELLGASLLAIASPFGRSFVEKLRGALGLERPNAGEVLLYAVFLANLAIEDEDLRERLAVYHKARTERP